MVTRILSLQITFFTSSLVAVKIIYDNTVLQDFQECKRVLVERGNSVFRGGGGEG